VNRELEKLRRAFTVAMDQGLIFARPKISKLKEDNVRGGSSSEMSLTACCIKVWLTTGGWCLNQL
jgi:hypothetical protein